MLRFRKQSRVCRVCLYLVCYWPLTTRTHLVTSIENVLFTSPRMRIELEVTCAKRCAMDHGNSNLTHLNRCLKAVKYFQMLTLFKSYQNHDVLDFWYSWATGCYCLLCQGTITNILFIHKPFLLSVNRNLLKRNELKFTSNS